MLSNLTPNPQSAISVQQHCQPGCGPSGVLTILLELHRKIGSGNIAEPGFTHSGLPAILPKVYKKSGPTILSNPIAARETTS